MAQTFNDYNDFEECKFTHTPDGYLTGQICVTGAGVFRYKSDDGKGIVRLLRPLNEVSKDESINGLNCKPVTLQHPDVDVTPENVQELSVGMSANDVAFDGLNARITLTVTRKDAIEAMERGEVRAISCGYSADVTPDTGNWQGTEYDGVMKNIKYNHIALVLAGRAGDAVNFRIGDSIDSKIILNTKGEIIMSKQLVINDKAFEVADEVMVEIDNVKKQLADATETVAKSKKALDEATAAKDAAEASVKATEAKYSDEAIAKIVEAKVALVAKAKEIGADVKVSDSDDVIKKSVIAKVFGDSIDLKDKSADYVDACFDIATKKQEPAKSALAPQMGKVADEADFDPEKAYKQMCDKITNYGLQK